jgi:hypothetical protein
MAFSEKHIAYLDTRDEISVPIGGGRGTDDRGRIKWPPLCACCGSQFKGDKEYLSQVVALNPQDVFMYEIKATITSSLGMGVQTSKFTVHIPLCLSCAPKKGLFGYASTTKDGTGLPSLGADTLGSGMASPKLIHAHMDFTFAMQAIKDGKDWRQALYEKKRYGSQALIDKDLRKRRVLQRRCVFCGQNMGLFTNLRAHKACGEYQDD